MAQRKKKITVPYQQCPVYIQPHPAALPSAPPKPGSHRQGGRPDARKPRLPMKRA